MSFRLYIYKQEIVDAPPVLFPAVLIYSCRALLLLLFCLLLVPKFSPDPSGGFPLSPGHRARPTAAESPRKCFNYIYINIELRQEGGGGIEEVELEGEMSCPTVEVLVGTIASRRTSE